MENQKNVVEETQQEVEVKSNKSNIKKVCKWALGIVAAVAAGVVAVKYCKKRTAATSEEAVEIEVEQPREEVKIETPRERWSGMLNNKNNRKHWHNTNNN